MPANRPSYQYGLKDHFPSALRLCSIVTAWCLLVILALLADTSTTQADARHDEFPEYPSIRNNIAFWEKIYSTYSINTVVIHDQNDLTKIYEAVNLVDKDLPGAQKINKSHINKIEEKYSDILLRLASGASPMTRDEARVAAMFKGPSAHKAMRIAADNIRAQYGQKERFYKGAIRSIACLKRIRQIFKAYGLPPDLAYLPHVESSFNPQAYSKSGASGIWQFTRSTGKLYMKINRHVDQRRDLIISTRAAARLLKKNYEALGSWPLAITAYNYGTSGMLRAVEAHGSYENIFKKYQEGYFKFASRNFYSEFLAARRIAKRLVDLKAPGQETTVSSGRTRTAGTPQPKVIKAARIKHIISRSSHPIRHLRPATHIRFYIVKRGDTASSIAAAHKITVNRLCKENNLSPKAIIRVGQNLKIPARSSGYEGKANVSPRNRHAKGIPTLSDSTTQKHAQLQGDET